MDSLKINDNEFSLGHANSEILAGLPTMIQMPKGMLTRESL